MPEMGTWEMVLTGVLVLLVLLWVVPGIRDRVKDAPRGTAKDWLGVLVPIGAVALFVALLIAIA